MYFCTKVRTMKHYIFFALMFFSLHLGAQCIIPITEVSKTIYVPIDEIAYVISSGTGASIVRQAGLRQLNTVEDVDSIVSLCSPSLLKFTDGSNGKVMAVSKTFIDRIVINGNGKAVIQTKNARIAYISFEDAEDLNVDILNCYGESKEEVETPGNCIKTITQSAHGFSEGDVLFWDTDEYVNLEGNYTGAEVPLYVVTDSLTANTFAAASCGEVDSDFGLADGLYYATNTGLELAPEEIEYPAVVVYGSKSKIVLNYGLEFDATGKPLFDIVTVTGQRTIDGGDVLDLHADSMRVDITIADTAATSVQHALELLKNNGSSTSNLDSLAALPDVVGINVLDRDVLERDSLNGRWINRNYYLRYVNNSLFLGQGTPKITNHTNFLGIGNNALAGYDPGGSPNGVFAIGNNSLLVYNNAAAETSAPFAIGHNTLKKFIGGSTILNNQFAIGNNAGRDYLGTAQGVSSWMVGNYAGSSLTTGCCNTFGGNNVGSTITTGAGNTFFGSSVLSSLISSTSLATVVGHNVGNYRTPITTASNAVLMGADLASTSANVTGAVVVGGSSSVGNTHQTIIGSYIGDKFSTSNVGSSIVGSYSYAGGTLSPHPIGSVVSLGYRNAFIAYVRNSITAGDQTFSYSTTNFSIGIGHAGSPIHGDSLILIGHAPTSLLDSSTLLTSTVIDPTTEYATIPAHGLAIGSKFYGTVSCSVCPAPLTNGIGRQFEVVNDSILKVGDNLTTTGDGVINIIRYFDVKNAIVVGHNVLPEANTIKLGSTRHSKAVLNQYKLNIDQSLTSTNDKQALRYNHSSGEIEVMSAGSNADLVTVEQTENITAIKFQIMPVNTTSAAVTITPPTSPIAGDWFAVSDSRGQASTNNITIDTSTDKLHGAANDHVISTTNGFVRLTYVNSTVGWIITN